MTKRSPKIGVRAYARTPIFGDPFNFREVLTRLTAAEEPGDCTLAGQTHDVNLEVIAPVLMEFFAKRDSQRIP